MSAFVSAPAVLALAAALLVTAMGVYPGGSASSPDTVGFDPWRDFLCDLLAERTHAGHDNTFAMVCARLGMVLTGLGMWTLWRDCPAARRWPRRHATIRCTATIAALAMPAPSDGQTWVASPSQHPALLSASVWGETTTAGPACLMSPAARTGGRWNGAPSAISTSAHGSAQCSG